jgi:methylenetetrahydrofolate reductase (NADPH)
MREKNSFLRIQYMTKIRFFRDDIASPEHFTITLELVPGTATRGRGVDTVMGLAKDAYSDGRISAVTITDNPGGNPALSPDVLAHDIFKIGMDVIVHFTCRDMNRVGMESRALQLDLMGIKNILALNGDYAGTGFGGQGAPVFDLDSVNLICMLSMLSDRLESLGDPERFMVGCAVSPFKRTEGETFAQYAKLCKKVSAGARFIITQLGYDARKFQELIQVTRHAGIKIPVIASLYHLSPKIAQVMHNGKVPGAVVTQKLLEDITLEVRQSPESARSAAIDRTAKLGAVLRGLGYRGVHIGGIHKNFDIIGRILDRMESFYKDWKSLVREFDYPQTGGFYFYRRDEKNGLSLDSPTLRPTPISKCHGWIYRIHETFHNTLFSFDSPVAPGLSLMAKALDRFTASRTISRWMEHPVKKILFNCQECGDCGLPHLAFLCPESQCPKHIRNGACGGSRDGRCEVRPDKDCVWVRAHKRLAAVSKTQNMVKECVPPRMWELNKTPSWLNFYLKRDHQSMSASISGFCSAKTCVLSPDPREMDSKAP